MGSTTSSSPLYLRSLAPSTIFHWSLLASINIVYFLFDESSESLSLLPGKSFWDKKRPEKMTIGWSVDLKIVKSVITTLTVIISGNKWVVISVVDRNIERHNVRELNDLSHDDVNAELHFNANRSLGSGSTRTNKIKLYCFTECFWESVGCCCVCYGYYSYRCWG